jgi:MFS family permease
MDSFKRGWEFLKQSWKMALADRDLIKPSIYTLIAGFIVSVVTFIPMGVVGFLLGDSKIGQPIVYILGAALIFIQYMVGYIFSAMTVYLIYGYLSEGDGRMDKAWEIVKRDKWDIASLAAASTLVNLVKGMIKGKGRSGLRNMLAGLLDTVWTEATFLVLPAMVIEDINLKDGLLRATQIIKKNLLLVGISTVGVRAVTGLIGFFLGILGIGLGFAAGAGIVTFGGQAPWAWVTGIGLGLLIAMPFILAATVISSYTMTAYHTCLYLWARDVERAQQGGSTGEVRAPSPLAAVLP